MSKDAYYFSHDSNAHKDPKVLKLRAKFGWEGYGIYWAIIETLREQQGYNWPSNDKELLSFSFANGEAMVNQIIDHCIDIGLLEDDGEYIYSESLLKRMNLYEEKRKKRVEAGKKGAQKRWNNNDSKVNQKQSYSNAIGEPMALHGKGKESKVKESKVNKKKYREHVYLSDDEYKRLCKEFGNELIDSKIEDLDNYIGSTGKYTKYKDHNRTIRAWIKKDRERTPRKVARF